MPPNYIALFPVLSERDKPNLIQSFNFVIENDKMAMFIKNKIDNNTPFIIPRVAGIENEMAFHGVVLEMNGNYHFPSGYFDKACQIMKKNAGIKISTIKSIIKYSQLYLEAFHQSDAYLNWEMWGAVAKTIHNSVRFIETNFSNKIKIWALALDVFNNIQRTPWTLSLKGKKILIISAFVKSIKEKINIREKIFGIDLFPECDFVFLKPPQTQCENESEEFDIELNRFVEQIKEIKETFDVALVSCGGYGNLVCSAIYKMGKSSIYVGGVLQMYFGIYGTRWVTDAREIMQLYKNEFWSRPEEDEKPEGFNKIENGCYW